MAGSIPEDRSLDGSLPPADDSGPGGRPLVSVVVPVWNKRHVVSETLASVESQSHRPIELIVIDDASTDGSEAVVDRWIEESTIPVRSIRNERNLGLNRSLNVGLARCTGEFVVCLDADDRMLPHMIENHVDVLLDAPEASFVYGDARRVDLQGGIVSPSVVAETRPSHALHGDVFAELLRDPRCIHVSAVTIRRSSLEEIGPFDPDLAFQDYDMWLRLARRRSVAFSGSLDAVVLVDPDSMQHTIGTKGTVTVLKVLDKWRHDPAVDRQTLSTIATGCVLALAGGQEGMSFRSSIRALRISLTHFPDPRLVLSGSRLLLRSAIGRRLHGRKIRSGSAPDPLVRPAPSAVAKARTR